MRENKDGNQKLKFEAKEEFTGLKTGKRKKKSAGIPGVLNALKHAFKYMPIPSIFKAASKLNQKGGFDCPGCAWPDPDDDRSALGEFCENGMKAISEEISKKIINGDFFENKSVSELREYSDFELGKLGRLGEPLIYHQHDDKYHPISWQNAFKLIAKELQDLDHPDQASFYTSGRTSNEAAFLYQLFVRMLGTNNLPDCSNMCHESSGVGLTETLGLGKGSVTLNDMHRAEVIIIMGQNPGTNHPRMLSALEKCKENGGKIITVNPLPEAGLLTFINPQNPIKIMSGGTTLTDIFLQVKINGDIPLLKGLMKILLIKDEEREGKVLDHHFIADYTENFNLLKEHLDKVSLDDCIEKSGIPLDLMESAVDLIADKEKIIVCWAMGLTQHKNGVNNIKEIVNLLLLKGAIGKEGAGTCPVRGHSNVQGDRTMGIYEAPSEDFLKRLDKVFNFTAPRKHGYSTVDNIRAMADGKVKVFMAMGGNFLSAAPDTNLTGRAMSNCKLTVHVSTKLNRSHLAPGEVSLILPCLGRSEKDIQKSGQQYVTVENSMGVVHSSKGILKPCSKNLKSEVGIICELAETTLNGKSSVNWKKLTTNYDNIRDLIEKAIPGFENFNQRIRKDQQFYLPNGPRTRKFNTPNGKAFFSINPFPIIETHSEELIMMTIRSHDQFNTTIYGLDDRYRGVYNERRVIMMNPTDMKVRNLKSKEVVNLKSDYKGVKRLAKKFIVIPYDIPEGCAATYFPEANALIPYDEFADKSKTPISKSVRIKIEKSAEKELVEMA
ncbi:MAG: hypothetical protein EA362_04545 [Saprospirales bacterium]|nr:MAG: hypothetical protein EA362_04545 [Saprospirales bacterium]